MIIQKSKVSIPVLRRYTVLNRKRNIVTIIAYDKEQARNIAVKARFVLNPDNLTVLDGATICPVCFTEPGLARFSYDNSGICTVRQNGKTFQMSHSIFKSDHDDSYLSAYPMPVIHKSMIATVTHESPTQTVT